MRSKKLHMLMASTVLSCCPLVTFTAVSVLPCIATAAEELDAKQLLSMDLAQLSNIEVTSVSKTPEKEKDAAAAIFVITQDDIRHSGATTIPDALRMAPGITVTQAGAHDWTVTSRGSNGQFSNKLLVLMDGRTIYSPLFSGVIWEIQDTMLEDIDRIEVIRGPGATLWGANAVNGVINIITKNAKDTQGGLAVATAGNQVNGIGSVREGIKLADDSYARVYAKHNDYNSEQSATGGSAGDSWHSSQAGFRSDSKLTDKDKLTVQGDAYSMFENANYSIPDLNSATYYSPAQGLKTKGGNVLTRWEQNQSADSQTTVQLYFDNVSRETSFFNDTANTIDLDVQHVWKGWERQEIVWGAGYRFINDSNNPPSAQYSLTPQTRNDSLYNAFIQDKIALLPKEIFLTLGSKFEHNAYSGIEVQPSARLSWLPTDNQTVWGAISRAVKDPYRYVSDGTQQLAIDPSGPALYLEVPTPNLKSEKLVAYELGYRIQPTKSLTLDASAFYNDYSNLFYATTGALTFPGAYAQKDIIINNAGAETSKGIELSTKYNVSSQWQWAAVYSYIDEVFTLKNSIATNYVGTTPKHQFNIRSTYMFPHDLEMTNALYYVDRLPGVVGVTIPGYYRFDTKLSWAVTPGMDISLVGQNLLRDQHREFSPFFYASTADVGRSIYGSVGVKF